MHCLSHSIWRILVKFVHLLRDRIKIVSLFPTFYFCDLCDNALYMMQPKSATTNIMLLQYFEVLSGKQEVHRIGTE